MSKQIKENCHKMIIKLENKLQELKVFLRSRKNQTILQKLLNQIINDFKFFQDEFKIITTHHSFLQQKSYEQQILISNYEKQLLNKTAEKKIFEHMMKLKYQKITKEQKFLEFAGKNSFKIPPGHQRTKSELIKKGLSELEKDIAENNKRDSIKVKELQQQIDNQQQYFLTFQNLNISKTFEPHQQSAIRPSQKSQQIYGNKLVETYSKTLDKREKIKNLQLNLDQNMALYKTNKKQLCPQQQQQSKELNKDEEAKSSQTVIINKKKKQELAELIAKQTKIVVSREKYFSTDI